MTNSRTEFEIQYEGENIPVIVTETERNDEEILIATVPGLPDFEIFLSEDDQWVTTDEINIEQDLVFLIGDTFESLQTGN